MGFSGCEARENQSQVLTAQLKRAELICKFVICAAPGVLMNWRQLMCSSATARSETIPSKFCDVLAHSFRGAVVKNFPWRFNEFFDFCRFYDLCKTNECSRRRSLVRLTNSHDPVIVDSLLVSYHAIRPLEFVARKLVLRTVEFLAQIQDWGQKILWLQRGTYMQRGSPQFTCTTGSELSDVSVT